MNETRLIADVGGTNTRIGLFDEAEGSIAQIREYRNSEHAHLEDIIALWLHELAAPRPSRGCIAVAAPPSGDRVTMINIGWSFSCRDLAARFGLDPFLCLNDFQANAHALPHLGDADLELVSAGRPADDGILATVGPGTGLGGATLRWVDGKPVAGCSEPGHVGLSPANELEIEIFRQLLREHGDIYAELLVSGAGLARLYGTIAKINGASPETLAPSEVSRRALAAEDPSAVMALETFCGLFGSACGDFLLANGAYGGLFIGGGIIPRMTGFLKRSDFLHRLRSKGAMARHLENVPVQVITEPHPGLLGAAHAPLQAG